MTFTYLVVEPYSIMKCARNFESVSFVLPIKNTSVPEFNQHDPESKAAWRQANLRTCRNIHGFTDKLADAIVNKLSKR